MENPVTGTIYLKADLQYQLSLNNNQYTKNENLVSQLLMQS